MLPLFDNLLPNNNRISSRAWGKGDTMDPPYPPLTRVLETTTCVQTRGHFACLCLLCIALLLSRRVATVVITRYLHIATSSESAAPHDLDTQMIEAYAELTIQRDTDPRVRRIRTCLLRVDAESQGALWEARLCKTLLADVGRLSYGCLWVSCARFARLFARISP